jgi:DNA modification methylase
MTNQIICKDSRKYLKKIPENSIDSIVTDPPYELNFMGKAWDRTGIAFDKKFWKLCYRVLKPGGYLLAFGGTRTYHRIACAIEDAGFEIRDQIQWIYGSGFPKSLNIGNGWGTALKPANEPICLARKPLSEKSVAENVLKWGTGGINIDGCRVETAEKLNGGAGGLLSHVRDNKVYPNDNSFNQSNFGRFPANVIHDGSEEVLSQFPDVERGELKEGTEYNHSGCNTMGAASGSVKWTYPAEAGSAARFFYCAKASRAERDYGLNAFEYKRGDSEYRPNDDGTNDIQSRLHGATIKGKNTHPTVKPVTLMRYLCKLITPVGGIVLDPFFGSGTTGMAAALEGFGFIGIEKEKENCDIAKARIAAISVIVEYNRRVFQQELAFEGTITS